MSLRQVGRLVFARAVRGFVVVLALVTSVGAAAVPEGGATPSPSPSPSPTPHMITVINNCRQQVWLGVHGAPAAPTLPVLALAPRCTDDSECASGTCAGGSCTCSADSDCTFNAQPGTTTATCDLVKQRCQKRVRFPVPATWNGRIWGRTGCSGSNTDFVCDSGQCGPSSGGNIDCQVQNADASLATLFELNALPAPGQDNYDVSLVSGYNLPMTVKVKLPSDAPTWKANHPYNAGDQIVERAKGDLYAFTNNGTSGSSGAHKPQFPFKFGHKVSDGAGVTWKNTGPLCAQSGCRHAGLSQDECPTALQVTPNGTYSACNVPDQVCSPSDPTCSLFLCKNAQSGAPTDLFGTAINLESPNGASTVCYSSDDCAPGRHCLLDPEFKAAGVAMPAGTGICMPVAQDGGCEANSTPDGDPCPDIYFPYPNATCQTFNGKADGKRVCLPSLDSGNSGFGNLWWNAENWTDQSSSCSSDTDCTTGPAGQKCFEAASQLGLKECTGPMDTCTCFAPSTCTVDADCPNTGKSCLDSSVAACPGGSSTCYCYPQAVYSGACGPSNQTWVDAAAAISNPPGATWPQGFRAACPVAYGYGFDDPSSNWFCPNGTVSGSNGYHVVFCGRNVKE